MNLSEAILYIPIPMRKQFAQLPDDMQIFFGEEFSKKKKTSTNAYSLLFLFGFHYLYLGKRGTQFLFWITFGGLGLWWFIDIFRTYYMVEEYNKDLAMNIYKDIKMMQ